MKTDKPLFKHQKQTLAKLKKETRFFDQSEPGTGKTRVEIEDFAARRAKGGRPAIVTATRSTLESAWADDFAQYAPDIKVAVAYANNREKAFASDADVYITNHDAVNWLAKQGKPFWKKFEGGTLINDESTAFKHATSQRSKNMLKIAQHFEHRRNMSGLADPNGVLDLWHQYLILDDGKRLGKSFFAFRSAVCTPEQVGPMSNMVKWNEKPGIANIVAALVKDITVKHLLTECVDMPPNTEYLRALNLQPKHAKHYAQMQDEMVTVVKDKVLNAVNKAVLRVKLLQIASGAVYNSEETGYSRFDTDRYEYVLDLVEECEHSVVFFQWEHQKAELVKEAERRGVSFAVYDGKTSDKERKEITEHYQKGAYRVIFAHPKSAAHGLTWVRGTRTIWASPTDNLEWYKQGLRRIYRIGQTKRTETITVVARGTYDEIAYERLTGKALRSDEFTAMLKKYIL
jgi:SNF2 family DNA or RNA helicase